MAGRAYSIKKNRIRSGYYPGFDLKEDGTLESVQGETLHYLFLRAIDSAANDSGWGRLSYNIECDENVVCYVYAAALNEDSFYRSGKPTRIEDFLCSADEDPQIKKEFFRRINAQRFAGRSDILLYSQKGRYLYLMLEVIGDGRCAISGMKADADGDAFMKTFPEVYREYNSFFHRYMSVFTSVYEEFQDDINRLPEYLDLDTCPARLLCGYGRWLGIELGEDFFDEQTLRLLVKEAYSLNRMKGTRAVLERLTEIVLGKKALVLERNMMSKYIDSDVMAEFERLYGNSVYDVTILVDDAISEVKKSQLMFLLNQYKPVRARLHMIYLKRNGNLDNYSYLDINAKVPDAIEGILDNGVNMSETIQLQ